MNPDILPLNAESLRSLIAEAKSRRHDKQRMAGNLFIGRLKDHFDKLIANPFNFTIHTSYSEQLEGDMISDDNGNFFIDYVATQLVPLGYTVGKSDDGGGRYSAIVVRWDVPAKKRYGGAMNDVDSMYPPGTK